MNRRDFGKMIAGSSVAAAIPLPGAAAASAQRSKYIFAVALAHAKTDVSADMIAETFNLGPSTARQLFAKLIRKGVVDAPNGSGFARLAEPLQRIVPQVVEYNPAGGYIVKGSLDELTAKARKLAEDMVFDQEDDTKLPVNAGDASDESGSVEPDDPALYS